MSVVLVTKTAGDPDFIYNAGLNKMQMVAVKPAGTYGITLTAEDDIGQTEDTDFDIVVGPGNISPAVDTSPGNEPTRILDAGLHSPSTPMIVPCQTGVSYDYNLNTGVNLQITDDDGPQNPYSVDLVVYDGNGTLIGEGNEYADLTVNNPNEPGANFDVELVAGTPPGQVRVGIRITDFPDPGSGLTPKEGFYSLIFGVEGDLPPLESTYSPPSTPLTADTEGSPGSPADAGSLATFEDGGFKTGETIIDAYVSYETDYVNDTDSAGTAVGDVDGIVSLNTGQNNPESITIEYVTLDGEVDVNGANVQLADVTARDQNGQPVQGSESTTILSVTATHP